MSNQWFWWVLRGVSAHDLQEALEAAPGHWVYAERPEDVVLTWKEDWLTLLAEHPLPRWSHGRAFAPQVEWVWWRREDDRFDVRVVTAEAQPPSSLAWELWPEAQTWHALSERAFLLVGTLVETEGLTSDPPVWRTLRIRRPLTYPVEPQASEPRWPSRVVLQVRPFVTPTGRPVAEQWLAVTGSD